MERSKSMRGVSPVSVEEDTVKYYYDGTQIAGEIREPLWVSILCSNENLAIQVHIARAGNQLWGELLADPLERAKRLTPGEYHILVDASQALTTEINIMMEMLVPIDAAIAEEIEGRARERLLDDDSECYNEAGARELECIHERDGLLRRLNAVKAERVHCDDALAEYRRYMDEITDMVIGPGSTLGATKPQQ